VTELQPLGEYEKALGLALLEIVREEEQQQRAISDERQTVPRYYWEAAIILRRLKRFDDEMALIRRFARNHDIHFRSFSRRHRSTPRGLGRELSGRLEEARAAAEKRARSSDGEAASSSSTGKCSFESGKATARALVQFADVAERKFRQAPQTDGRPGGHAAQHVDVTSF
jgi:hypothetical protein